jgi:hypothetical protein
MDRGREEDGDTPGAPAERTEHGRQRGASCQPTPAAGYGVRGSRRSTPPVDDSQDKASAEAGQGAGPALKGRLGRELLRRVDEPRRSSTASIEATSRATSRGSGRQAAAALRSRFVAHPLNFCPFRSGKSFYLWNDDAERRAS